MVFEESRRPRSSFLVTHLSRKTHRAATYLLPDGRDLPSREGDHAMYHQPPIELELHPSRNPGSRTPAPAIFAVTAVVAALASGCNHTPRPGETIEEVCVEANDGKNVTVSGYMRLWTTTTECTFDGCRFLIAEDNSSSDTKSIVVKIHEGKGPRRIEFLKRRDFSTKDLVFRDDAEATYFLGDVVRATGKLVLARSGDRVTCWLTPSSIEKVAD
jgi:hypothetical protein